MLRNKSRPYLFSNTLAPAIVGASLKVIFYFHPLLLCFMISSSLLSLQMFDMISATTERRDRLERNTLLFRKLMGEAGFKLKGAPNHPIAPVMLGDAALANQMAEKLLKKACVHFHFFFIFAFRCSFPIPFLIPLILLFLSLGHLRHRFLFPSRP